MDFSFFIENNKSGYKTREKWLEKNHPQDYTNIIDYCSNINLNLSFKEKIYFYFHKLKDRPKCKTCNGEIKFRERFDDPYGDFCSLDCINNNKQEMIERQKKTFNKKYGVDFYPQHKDFVKKQKQTKLEKYGDENFVNFEKAKKTKLERYGDENYINIEKAKKTNLEKYGVENYAKSKQFSNTINQKFKKIYPNLNISKVTKKTLTIICNECEQECELEKHILNDRYKRNIKICVNCNPIGYKNTSSYEKELSEFLNLLNVNHLTSYKILKNKRELDIFIPQKNIAIEINGVYFHNELFLHSNYHLEKTIECQKNDINLIHIFEDEWVYKKDIVKSIIKNKLNLIDNFINSELSEIKKISDEEKKTFLTENHIEGDSPSNVNLGLFYKNELMSIMCFIKKQKNEWELTRFCNRKNTKVLGSASKLFNFFIKNYSPEKIISYSDIRYFDGGLYEKLNFDKISQSKPNYWYVVNGIRQHRFNFRKSVLIKEGYDKDKTEKEIMFDRKIYRIYDCGNIRWEWKNKIKDI